MCCIIVGWPLPRLALVDSWPPPGAGLAGNRLGMPWHGQRPAQRGRPGQTNGIDSSSSAGEASMGGVGRIGGAGVKGKKKRLPRKMNR